MTTDFTKVKWAGSECILVTIRENNRIPVLILTKEDINNLLNIWKGEKG